MERGLAYLWTLEDVCPQSGMCLEDRFVCHVFLLFAIDDLMGNIRESYCPILHSIADYLRRLAPAYLFLANGSSIYFGFGNSIF